MWDGRPLPLTDYAVGVEDPLSTPPLLVTRRRIVAGYADAAADPARRPTVLLDATGLVTRSSVGVDTTERRTTTAYSSADAAAPAATIPTMICRCAGAQVVLRASLRQLSRCGLLVPSASLLPDSTANSADVAGRFGAAGAPRGSSGFIRSPGIHRRGGKVAVLIFALGQWPGWMAHFLEFARRNAAACEFWVLHDQRVGGGGDPRATGLGEPSTHITKRLPPSSEASLLLSPNVRFLFAPMSLLDARLRAFGIYGAAEASLYAAICTLRPFLGLLFAAELRH